MPEVSEQEEVQKDALEAFWEKPHPILIGLLVGLIIVNAISLAKSSGHLVYMFYVFSVILGCNGLSWLVFGAIEHYMDRQRSSSQK